jgi:hypothetical protein
MLFDHTSRARRTIAALMAASVIGSSAAGAAAVAHGTSTPAPKTVRAAANASTVPAPLTRAETAAEDVIGFLESGHPAKSKAEARILRDLAHGKAADALRRAGVSQAGIQALQQRADRVARLSLGGASALRVSLAANSVSQLMPGFYARFHDRVPVTVLRLDYLDREIQLRSRAGQARKVEQVVRQLAATWRELRPQLVAAGGTQVATSYDRHVTALQRGGTAAAVQKQAVHGLDIVDQMETVFLK